MSAELPARRAIVEDREPNIVHETSTHYVYRVSPGIYEVREHRSTHSIAVGRFENEDEDEDTRTRAVEMCDELSGAQVVR